MLVYFLYELQARLGVFVSALTRLTCLNVGLIFLPISSKVGS